MQHADNISHHCPVKEILSNTVSKSDISKIAYHYYSNYSWRTCNEDSEDVYKSAKIGLVNITKRLSSEVGLQDELLPLIYLLLGDLSLSDIIPNYNLFTDEQKGLAKALADIHPVSDVLDIISLKLKVF